MPKNVIGSTLSTSFHGSTGHKIFGSNGSLWQGGIQVFSTKGELLQNSSDLVQPISYTTALGFSSSNINSAGITYIYPSDYTNLSSSDRACLYLSNPVPGCEKKIQFDSGSTNVLLDIRMVGASIFGTNDWSTKVATKTRYIHFSTVLNGVQTLRMTGLSTSLWSSPVVGPNSTDIGGWGAATGIRTSTAARTS